MLSRLDCYMVSVKFDVELPDEDEPHRLVTERRHSTFQIVTPERVALTIVGQIAELALSKWKAEYEATEGVTVLDGRITGLELTDMTFGDL